MRIIVLGYIIKGPIGGLCWHHLQYVLGLKKMGHEVLFIEDSGDEPMCYNPQTHEIASNADYGIQFIRKLFQRFELNKNWAYYDAPLNQWQGLSQKEVLSFCTSADVAINISAVNPMRDWWHKIPIKVLIDTDPAFTQIKHLTDPAAKELASHHTSFFSFAENINQSYCTLPNDGFKWKPTRQPVIIDLWKTEYSNLTSKWTTVMQWDSYKVQQYSGKTYGMKSASFDEFLMLPQLANDFFELAIGSSNAPREKLKKEGWEIANPLSVALTPENYQDYITQSKGEWSIAKHGYVISKSGWFSERSLGYMASGKPVVLQDTGFSNYLQTGKGLLPFTNIEEAVEAIKKANMDIHLHGKWARQIVEDHFEASIILKQLIDSCY